MKLAVVKNRFSNLSWRGFDWIESESEDINCDFLLWQGPNIEILFHPLEFTKFRENELCGVLWESESIHLLRPDFPAPIGYPKWRDDFFVLKAGKYAIDFLRLWRESKDVADTVWRLGVRPIQYPNAIIKVHCPGDAMPEIQWGVA
jgi:hypothetical protein